MSRLNAALVYSVMFFCCLDISVVKSVKIIQEWTADHYTRVNRPIIFKAKEEILVVDLPLKDTISFMSIDGVKINTCNFSIPSDSSYSLPLNDAMALGNGKIVVHNLMAKNLNNFDLYIILDPWDCSSMKTIEIVTGFSIEDRSMIPYHDTFDLIYENRTFIHSPEFSVCRLPLHLRYNDQGESISLKHQLGPDTTTLSFRIQTVKPYDASEGYISTMASEDGLMVLLKHLDSNFRLVKQSILGSYNYDMVIGRIDNGVNFHSVASMTNDSISICFRINGLYRVPDAPHCTRERNRQSIFCQFFDARQGIGRLFIKLYETNGNVDFDVVNLPDGHAAVVRASYPDSGAEYYLHQVFKSGSMVEPVRIDFPGKSRFVKIIHLKDSKICLVAKSWIEEDNDIDYNLKFTHQSKVMKIITKCIDIFVP
ncbi:hypothetical protein TSAR_011687 [Trichomalopsis sarcophagae]|uniref:Uncharacterized protein n=1 Tax=Trichomalopsis sarcophagae TaxID=543379 RepID=A0A232EKS6_9HYME|nr:hypothetical protein TSAR_011687 [Trichomalopsis sarcophagae]